MNREEIHVEVVNGLSTDKLRFYTRHFKCSQGLHRCCEYSIEIPVDLAKIIKMWTLFLASIVCLNGFFREITCLFTSIYCTIFIIAVLNIFTCVTKESLFVEMEMIGIQQTTVYWFGWKVTEILNREDIVDVIINEAITMGQVIFYLTVVLKDKSLKPLLTHSKPRLYCLQKIYTEIQDILQKSHNSFYFKQEKYFFEN